jgi:hypothetical protein
MDAHPRERFLERFDVRSYAARLARLHAGMLDGRRSEAGAEIAAGQDHGDPRSGGH